MDHTKEFSKHSKSYDTHTIVQKQVASHLVSKIISHPKRILDLGCGTGEVSKNIFWKYDKLLGVDEARGMCEKHPKSENIALLNENFESDSFRMHVNNCEIFDIVISSSALQWSKDIENTLRFLRECTKEVALAIFTDNTFSDIYSLSKLETFLPNAHSLIETAKKYFSITYEIKTYRLSFEDNISKFRYIQKSGTTGGMKRLGVTQMKNLLKNYPHDYLEFEVLFIWGAPIKRNI